MFVFLSGVPHLLLFWIEKSGQYGASTNSSRVMARVRMLSVCGDHATVYCHSVDPTPPVDVTTPGYSLPNISFSVYMDSCILSAPSWASYKHTFYLYRALLVSSVT